MLCFLAAGLVLVVLWCFIGCFSGCLVLLLALSLLLVFVGFTGSFMALPVVCSSFACLVLFWWFFVLVSRPCECFPGCFLRVLY